MVGVKGKMVDEMVEWVGREGMGGMGEGYGGEGGKEKGVGWINEWVDNKGME